MARLGATTLAVVVATALMASPASADVTLPDSPTTGVLGGMDENGVSGIGVETPAGTAPPPATGEGSGSGAAPAGAAAPRYELKTALACSSGQATPAEATAGVSNCTFSETGCQFETPPSDVRMYYFYRRPIAGGPWELLGDNCNPAQIPAGAPAPPPTPTIGQIRQAFMDLPFAKPTVNVQPEGDVTLVNLPTYFEAQWPAGKLSPGDVSSKVQLLSWSIEFKVNPASYNYAFGDGSASGWTDDVGGPYPEGLIRHTYEEPVPAAAVKVDATLTGSYRVNGGAWIDLGGVADLQDEPVTTLQVREAKARLR